MMNNHEFNRQGTQTETTLCKPRVGAVTELCGISVPVFQAAMAGLSGPALVAAVSNAGGLGHLGALRVLPKTLRGWIHETRRLTDKPFGVNLVPQYGGPDFFEAAFKVVLDEKPKVLSLFYGDFEDIISRAKDVGIVTMVQVGSLSEARKAVRDGADILIAQGIESGGHIRGRVGLTALLPAVVDVAGGLPVLAAGAIGDTRAVRAARCLGASGVWCGTAFLTATECDAHEAYKQKLLDADTDAPKFLTGYSYGWKYGTPHRSIIGKGGWNLLRFMGGGIRKVDDPKMADKLSLYAGQGIGQSKKMLPASVIVKNLAQGFCDATGSTRSSDRSVTPSVKYLSNGAKEDIMHCIMQDRASGMSIEQLSRKYEIAPSDIAGLEGLESTMPILDPDRLTEVEGRFRQLPA